MVGSSSGGGKGGGGDGKGGSRTVCKNFAAGGQCQFGDRCRFAHGEELGRQMPRGTPSSRRSLQSPAPASAEEIRKEVSGGTTCLTRLV